MQIMDMIQGVQPLPWEDPDTAPVLMRNFRYFKNAVMSLLERGGEVLLVNKFKGVQSQPQECSRASVQLRDLAHR
jgi:hypothetical protein